MVYNIKDKNSTERGYNIVKTLVPSLDKKGFRE